MKVKALKDGFYNGGRIREGTVFHFKGEAPAKWMEPVTEGAPVKAKGKDEAKVPRTFSEVTKAEAKALAPKGGEDLV